MLKIVLINEMNIMNKQSETLGYTDTVLLNAFCVNRVSDVHVQKRSKNPSMVNKLLKCLCSVCVLCFELFVSMLKGWKYQELLSLTQHQQTAQTM